MKFDVIKCRTDHYARDGYGFWEGGEQFEATKEGHVVIGDY